MVGGGEVANTTARKTSINQSILSVINPDITITGRRFIYFIIQFRDGVDFVESEIDSEKNHFLSY